MAQRFFGINRGAADEHAVIEGSSTTSRDVEVTVNLDSNITKGETYILLNCIRDYLSRSLYPKDN